MKNQKKGFTLIELLVVIAIIGILSAIGLVALNGAREKARDAQRKSDLAQYRTALALFYDSNQSTYPDQIGGTTDSIADTGVASCSNCIFSNSGANALVPTHIGAVLNPPGGGTTNQRTYHYDSNIVGGVNPSSYVLYTQLEGGTANYYRVYDTGLSCENTSAAPAACTTASGTPCATSC